MAIKKTTADKKTQKKEPEKAKKVINKVASKSVKPTSAAKKAPKAPVKTTKPAKKTAVNVVKNSTPAKKPSVPKIIAPASKVASSKKVAPKKAAPAASKADRLAASSSAMDSFKKTLNAVHKRGMEKLSLNDRKMLKNELQNLRDRVLGEIEFLTDDSLNRSMKETAGDMTMHGMHMADHGTDNFDREFALNLVSAEHDVLYDIDDALRRIDDGTYGSCEECGCQVEKARLEALPFARLCIRCKSEKEKGAIKYRPLGPTLSTRS